MSGPDQGLVVFLSGTAPGDLVEYSVIERKKNFMRGRVTRVVEAGPGRTGEACPVASLCGGCTWQHLSYGLQLEWKRRIVEESLARIARITNCEVRQCIPSPEILGYRNKVEVPLAEDKGRVVAGFFEPYTHRVVPSDECPLEHPLAREVVVRAVEEIRRRKYSVYSERTGRGLVRHVVARVAPGTGERMAVLVANSRSLPGEADLARNLTASLPDLKSVVLNTNMRETNIILGEKNKLLSGRPYIEDLLGGGDLPSLKFRISPHSFSRSMPPRQCAYTLRRSPPHPSQAETSSTTSTRASGP
jgi:23S rRNA (uracil1939-C5)-methyltransferase